MKRMIFILLTLFFTTGAFAQWLPAGPIWSTGPNPSDDAVLTTFRHPGTVEIPNCSTGKWLKYVTVSSAHFTKPLGGIYNTVYLVYQLNGSGTLVARDGGAVVGVRPYFQRRGDNRTGEGVYAAYRWWGTKSILQFNVQTAVYTYLHRNYWVAVYNSSPYATIQAFEEARADPVVVGFTFGANTAGHGICVRNGYASFTVFTYGIP